MLFRQLRILFLLIVLFLVAAGTYLTQLRTTDWDRPLVVAIYPINGDGSAQSSQYIETLTRDRFNDVESFFMEEADSYNLPLKKPVKLVMGATLSERPPEPPYDRNVLGVIWWSLNMRYWAWNIEDDYGPSSDIQIFVLYHNPVDNPVLSHSLGLQKGLVGVVHAFADGYNEGGNSMVIAHELLHTLGATDKYDMQTSQPIFPVGYAEPDKDPIFPQTFAELMAGRIPISDNQADQPSSLDYVVVGDATAREIRWIE